MIRFPLHSRLSGTAEHAYFVRQVYGFAEIRIAKPVGRGIEVDGNARRADLDMGSKQFKQSADFAIIGRNVSRRQPAIWGFRSATSEVDGTTIEPRIRINRPDWLYG
jgi:hypothetical protein